MDASGPKISFRRVILYAVLLYGGFSVVALAVDPKQQPPAPVETIPAPGTGPAARPAEPKNQLPMGDKTRQIPAPPGTADVDSRTANWSTDPNDPFPMPPELDGIELMKQTAETAHAKSAGCINCHQTSHDPHYKDTLHIGCTDCHGGDATCGDKMKAHVQPRYPQFWPTSANPVRTYTLLNHEDPMFIRFVNPGDFRIAHISCGTSGCHPKEVQNNRKNIMSTGCMLWGAALYNNGAVPFKKARFGEMYSMNGAPVRIITNPPPTKDEMDLKGVLPFLDPMPRYEVSQPGNILRIFEPGGRFDLETGIPELKEEPGRPRARLSTRGIGTKNRTDPVTIGLNKTRLFDPTLNFMGTNDQAGDFRNSGCTACHVVYANDRSATHSGPWAKFGNRGLSANTDPTIPKDEPGHPIEHRFVMSAPTSQCMVCHVHPGTTVMNSYIGYMWWDEDSSAELIYPKTEKKPTPEEMIAVLNRNPNESAAKSNLADREFVTEMAPNLNDVSTKAQFGDFHSHGWAFRAVYKKDRDGNYIDFHGKPVGRPTPAMLKASTEFASKVRDFHRVKHDDPQTSKKAEDAFDRTRGGQPVHLMDIHMEKGMHCVDCHFSQDMHGNGRIQQEVRAATEIACVDCHGTGNKYTTLRTSGVASYTSAPNGLGRDMKAMRTPFGKPRFEVEELPDGRKRFFQNSSVEKGIRWEMVQTKDTVDINHPRYNAKSAIAKTVRWQDGQMVWGDRPDDFDAKHGHGNSNMSCIACHSSWNPSCFGCHLPQRANMKMPQLHSDGDITRNYTSYCFQTLRDDVYTLARDGDVTGNKINPSRSSCAVHVTSYNANRESIYTLQQTVSSDGYGGTAFSTNVPHTVRGKGVRETKGCTDCHLSAANDNNALIAQLMMHGTGFLNLIGKYCYVAAGEEGLFAVQVTEQAEPQAVIGSDLHRTAYPQSFAEHLKKKNILQLAHEHPGKDVSFGLTRPFGESEVLNVLQRGEYLYAACGKGGVRLFDIAFVDDKGFAERITTAPVSPAGQRFYVPTKDARHIAAPSTVALDPTRKMNPANKEQPIHGIFAHVYVADAEEGLLLVGAGTVVDGNPINNFLKVELKFNPDGLLKGARFVQIVGHYAYVCCDAGLVVVDLDDPMKPKVTSVLGEHNGGCGHGAKMVAVQFRYGFVLDEHGVKVLDCTDLAKPVLKGTIKLEDARGIYLARTKAYVAAGHKGLVILDITNPEAPKLDQIFDANGCINDAYDVKLGITYNSLFAYIADGKNGLRVVQLINPDTPGFEGFSPKPTPKLVATFRTKHEGKILSVSRGLDRDRAVDETGHQVGVFGRVGARPFNYDEQRKIYLHDKQPWYVTDDPYDTRYKYAGPTKTMPAGK